MGMIPWGKMGKKRPERKPVTWTEGYVHAKVEAFTENEHADGRKYYTARSRVIAPEAQSDQAIFDNFWVGTHDDPNFEKEETHEVSVAGKLLEQFAECFDIEPDRDSEVFAAQIKGREFLPYVKPRPYTDDQGNHKVSADVKKYAKLGEAAIGATNGQAGDAVTTTETTSEPTRYAEVPE